MATVTVLEKKAYIGGEWTESESGEWFEVKYPGDGHVFGRVPRCTPQDVDRAVEAAQAGQKAMAQLSVRERARLLYKASEIAERRAEEAARIHCQEVGKTINEARDEIRTSAPPLCRSSRGHQADK